MIDQDGTVLFDNNANIGGMENHLNRPEVEEASKNGEGTAIRKSNTMNTSTYYYALRLEDGSLIRGGKRGRKHL